MGRRLNQPVGKKEVVTPRTAENKAKKLSGRVLRKTIQQEEAK
jgi:hypothetical protein